MLRRLVALFEPERCARAERLLELIVSDYVAYYAPTPQRLRWGVAVERSPESPSRMALLFVPRVLHNPCMHAVILIRLAGRSPGFTMGLWRTLLIWKHSIDIQPNMRFGPGLVLPHPVGLTLGWGLRAGRNVTILHYVSIGGLVHRREERVSPTLGDDVVVYGHSMVLGGITVGEGAIVGAATYLDRDLPAGAVHKAGR